MSWMEMLRHVTVTELLVVALGMAAGALAALQARTRRREARLLGEAEQRLRLFFQQVPALVWATDRALVVTAARGSQLADLGMDDGAVRGRDMRALLQGADDPATALHAHEQALGGEPASYTVNVGPRSYECRVEPLRGADGEVRGVAGLAVDVSRWRAAGAALRASDERNQRIVANVPGVVYQYRQEADGSGRFTFASERCVEVLGISAAALTSDPGAFVGTLDPEDIPGLLAAIPPREQAPCAWSWEGRVIHPDGRRTWMQLTARMVVEPDGALVWDGLMLDVTERRRIAQELQERLRGEEMLGRVASALLGAGAPLEEALRLLGEEMAASRAYVYHLPGPGDAAVLVHGWRAADLPPSAHPAPVVDVRALGWTGDGGDVRVVDDVEALPGHPGAERDHLRARGIRSLVLAPLRAPGGDEALGFIGLDVMEQARPWTAHQVRALEVVALMLSGARARARAEFALERSRARERHVLSASPNITYVLAVRDGVPRHDWISPNVAWILGYTPEEAMEPGWWVSNVHPDDRAAAVAASRAALSEGVVVKEFRFRQKNGAYRWLRDEQRMTRDPDGTPVEIVGSWADVTARKHAEEAQREQTNLLRALLDSIPIPVFCKDPQGLYFDCNSAFAELVGLPRVDILWRTAAQVLPPALAAREEASDGALLGAGGRDAEEVSFAGADGAARAFIRCRATFLRSGGTPGGIVGTLQDITARKRAEEALRESERHFRMLIENSADMIVVVDADGAVSYVSPSVERLLGHGAGEMLGRQAAGYLHPEDAPAVAATLARIGGEPGAIAAVEYRCRDRWGAWHTLDAVVQNRLAEAGGVVLNARDVTDRKVREADLRDRNAALQNAAEGIARIDWTGRLLAVNQAYAEILGTDPETLSGAPWADCIHPDDRAEVLAACAALEAGHKLELDLRLERPDGGIVFARTTLLTAYDEEGGTTGWHCFMKDVTGWKQLNAQLQRAQKLEAIGQLAAGVAHEINTPVQYVGDNVRFLEESLAELEAVMRAHAALSDAVLEADGADARALAAAAREEAEAADVGYLLAEMPRAASQALEGLGRVAEIVRAMKEFSHPGTAERTPVDINRAIVSTLTVARNEWKYVAELVTELDETLPPVPCLPGDFNQVVLNLVVNAAHAIADKVGDGASGLGTITVSTAREGEWAEVRVADTGCGIPEAVRGRVFDPFFTTKPVGRGTGQGLTLAHAVIVDKHGGTLHFESETGRGTTFIIRLPLAVPREMLAAAA